MGERRGHQIAARPVVPASKPSQAEPRSKTFRYSKRIRVAESRPMCKQGRCAERLFHSPQPLVTVESLEPPKRRILPLEGRQRIIWYTQLSSSAGGQESAFCGGARGRLGGSQAVGTHFVLNWKDGEEKKKSSTAAERLRFLNKRRCVPNFCAGRWFIRPEPCGDLAGACGTSSVFMSGAWDLELGLRAPGAAHATPNCAHHCAEYSARRPASSSDPTSRRVKMQLHHTL